MPWPNSLLRFRKPQVVLMRAYDSPQGPTSELCANLSNLCAALERLKTASYSLSRLRRTDFWRDCFFSDGGDCKFRWGGGGISPYGGQGRNDSPQTSGDLAPILWRGPWEEVILISIIYFVRVPFAMP